MDNLKIMELMKTIESQENMPGELKDKILRNVCSHDSMILSRFEMFVYLKPIRSAAILSIVVSGVIFLIMGNDYYRFLL